jgi:hypothetical protein
MNWELSKRDYEDYENIWQKVNLKHKAKQWKLGASMKNMKEFEVFGKKKNLESL